jgi:hypothetical protein
MMEQRAIVFAISLQNNVKKKIKIKIKIQINKHLQSNMFVFSIL